MSAGHRTLAGQMADETTPTSRKGLPQAQRTQPKDPEPPGRARQSPRSRITVAQRRGGGLSQAQRTQGDAQPDMREIGLPGSKILAGLVYEEDNADLQGLKGLQTFKDMGWDPTVRALLMAYSLPIRASRWFMEPASDDPDDVRLADFIHHNLWNFGTQSFDDVVRLALEDKQYGFAWSEMVYDHITDGDFAGMVGWDKFAYRSQISKWRWNVEEVDTPGGGRNRQLVSVTQLAPPTYVTAEIPREKLLIWVNDQQGENFDGWSLLRPAYKGWYYKDLLSRLEAIGLERSYMGIPYAKLPEDYSDAEQALAKAIVENLRTHENAGVVLTEAIPLEMLFNKLEGAPMRAAVEFWDTQILMAGLAGFLKLGMSGRGGAYSLAQEFDYLFLLSLNAAANRFAETINLWPGIPLLTAYNFGNVDQNRLPKLSHGDIGQRSLDKLGRTLQALGQWGFLTPDPETEDQLRRFLDLPERDDTVTPEALRDLVQEVMPKEAEYGKQYGPMQPAPLVQVAQIGANAKTQAAQQQSAVAQARGTKGGRGQAASAADRQSKQAADQTSRNNYDMSEVRALQARMPWPRADYHNPAHRPRVQAAYLLAETLEEMRADVTHGTAPDRPSVALAKRRKPYVLLSDRAVAAQRSVSRERAVQTVQTAMAKARSGDLSPVPRPHDPPDKERQRAPHYRVLAEKHEPAIRAFFDATRR